MTLDKQDVQFYQQNGYWIAPPLFGKEELTLFREHMDRIIQGDYETKRPPWARNIDPGAPIDRLIKIDNSYWCDSVIAKLVLSPVIGEIAAQLAGVEGIRLWHDQMLYKPSQSGGAVNVGWHQDYHYWQCVTPPNLLTAWVAFDDITEEIGCMKAVPGSHEWGLLPEGDFFEQDLHSLQEKIVKASGKPFETAKCEMPAGAVSFHHCLTLHGSGTNTSGRPRRSIAIHLMPDGSRYRAGSPADGHMNVKLLSGQDGDAFLGPYFPVLHRARQQANPFC